MRSRSLFRRAQDSAGPRQYAIRQVGPKKFEGTKLYNKTLAIIGMGRMGSRSARRAIAFGMRVVAYDPYLSAGRARSLQVELVESIDEILPQADFLRLHTPLTPETNHLLKPPVWQIQNGSAPDQLRARRLDRRDRRFTKRSSGQDCPARRSMFLSRSRCQLTRSIAGFPT